MRIAVLAIAALVALTMAVHTIASFTALDYQIQPTTTTGIIEVPRLRPYTGISPTVPTETTTTRPTALLTKDRICVMAQRSPSGEALVFDTFTWIGTTREIDRNYDNAHALFVRLSQEGCPTERGTQIMRETIPYITEAQG